MMGPAVGQQDRLFYEFDLDDRVPADHLLRRIDATDGTRAMTRKAEERFGITARVMRFDELAADAAPRTMSQRLVRWLGAMHPAAVHFPIALFLVAAVLEIAALTLRRPVLTQGTRVIIALAAISAIGAVVLGWFAMGLPGNDDVTHTYHRWLGTSIAGLGLATWWAKEHWIRRPGRGRELIYIGLLSVTAAAILVNALLGGMLTHGVRHLMF